MTAPQRPGDLERDRLAEEYAPSVENLHWFDDSPGQQEAMRTAFSAGWDKAMDRTAALVERKDRQISAFEQKIITLEAEVKRLHDALVQITRSQDMVTTTHGHSIERLSRQDMIAIAREALAPRREISGA